MVSTTILHGIAIVENMSGYTTIEYMPCTSCSAAGNADTVLDYTSGVLEGLIGHNTKNSCIVRRITALKM